MANKIRVEAGPGVFKKVAAGTGTTITSGEQFPEYHLGGKNVGKESKD
jgi:hypothetical protein